MSESDIQKICSTQYDSLLTSGLFAFIKQIIITEIWSKALVVLSWGHKLHVYVARQKDLRAQIREGFKAIYIGLGQMSHSVVLCFDHGGSITTIELPLKTIKPNQSVNWLVHESILVSSARVVSRLWFSYVLFGFCSWDLLWMWQLFFHRIVFHSLLRRGFQEILKG